MLCPATLPTSGRRGTLNVEALPIAWSPKMFSGAVKPIHLILVVVVLVLLFGAKKLPDAARSLAGRCAT
jgi:hypothetical protein